MVYRGTFRNGVIVFDKTPPLKNGQRVQVKKTARRRPAPKRGTGAALLKHAGIWAEHKDEVHRLLKELHESKQAEVALERQRLGLPPQPPPHRSRPRRA